VRLISRIAIAAFIFAFGPRLTVVMPTWLSAVVVLLAYVGIVLWSQRLALRNPEKKGKK
jgi:hypothetical protein